MYKETLKLLSEGGYQIISKIITGNEVYLPFYGVPTCLKREVWISKISIGPSCHGREGLLKLIERPGEIFNHAVLIAIHNYVVITRPCV